MSFAIAATRPAGEATILNSTLELRFVLKSVARAIAHKQNGR